MSKIQHIKQEEIHRDPLTGKVRVTPIWPEDLHAPCKIPSNYIRYNPEDLPWPVEIVGYDFRTDSYIVIRTDQEFPGYLIVIVNQTAGAIERLWEGVKYQVRATWNLWRCWS